MKKLLSVCLIMCLCVAFVGCNRSNSDNLSLDEKTDEKSAEKMDEMFADDYLEYPTVEKADDYFRECFKKIEGDWRDGDRVLGFYIDDKDDLYMMSGWTDRDRIIAFIDPVRNHENQFEIGLEAGELQEILRCEIVEENKTILINRTEYVRTEE